MISARVVVVALTVSWLMPGVAGAQPPGSDARLTALIGLARTARDQGRVAEAATRFREADRLQPFAGALLVEYFWAAQAARAAEAMPVGGRVLLESPRDRQVRDGMIGLAVASGDETAAARLAEQGRLLEPNAALWMRRLGESHLRVGRYLLAAQQFLAASNGSGALPDDRAQWAFCLELSGQKASAAQAWMDIPDSLSSSRRDWAESRARATAPAPAPPVRRAVAPAPTPSDIAAASARRLAAEPCAAEPLTELERLADGQPFVTAVAARPSTCGDRALWVARAVEREIAIGEFERALALAQEVPAEHASVELREQVGVLLHWTGENGLAVPVLRGLVGSTLDRPRAETALIEALRATGESDEAWSLADRAWRGAPQTELRLGLAELALETGRLEEALRLSLDLDQDDLLGERAAVVEGAALQAIGRAADARRVLERALPSAAAAVPWMEAVAATDGIAVALAESDRLPVTPAAAWADVHLRRAVWHARLGHLDLARASLARVSSIDPARAALGSAEIALAAGRPIDAERTLRQLLAGQPRNVRALEALATALAEQGRFDEAQAVLAALRERRPTELRWAILEADWRHRQVPTAEHLEAVESLARATTTQEARSAMARALFRSGEFARALAALGAPASLAEPDRLLVARSLRALGRPTDALDVLRARPIASLESQFLAAELDAAVNGPAAADRSFAALMTRGDADPAWYLAWADLYSTGGDRLRVLEAGVEQFPSYAPLQERLAVTAWAGSDVARAAQAADAAIALDSSRTGAWFVKVELAGRQRDTTLVALLDEFQSRFAVESEARVGMAEMVAGLTRSADDPAAARALGWMEERLVRDPRDAPAAVARARLLAATGRIAGALDAVDALVTERPDLASALRLRAELLGASARYAEAVAAYDRYLAVAPEDVAARRQQARVEGWRGAYGAAEARYDALLERESDAPSVLAAEATAKHAYYDGNWTRAAARYDRWLLLDPKDVEAQLERAQLDDRLGQPDRALERFQAVAATVAPNDVATVAAERIQRRLETSVDMFSNGQSADAAERQQLLDLVDSGVGVADDLGLGYNTRARLFGGPSMAEGEGGPWRGHHAGLQLTTAIAALVRVKGSVAYRKLDALDASWFGDLGMTWRLGSRVRVAAGAERTLLLENASTLAAGIHGVGPTASVRWTPTLDFSLEGGAARLAQSDDNIRRTLRVAASERVLRGRNELRLVAAGEGLGYRDERPTYFTPSSFWRLDAGAEWRGWIAMPRFFGDRERWVSAGYTLGVDDREVRYHTARGGFSYELAGGVAFVADGQLTRSPVYNGGRLSIGLRLKQISVPEP